MYVQGFDNDFMCVRCLGRGVGGGSVTLRLDMGGKFSVFIVLSRASWLKHNLRAGSFKPQCPGKSANSAAFVQNTHVFMRELTS